MWRSATYIGDMLHKKGHGKVRAKIQFNNRVVISSYRAIGWGITYATWIILSKECWRSNAWSTTYIGDMLHNSNTNGRKDKTTKKYTNIHVVPKAHGRNT